MRGFGGFAKGIAAGLVVGAAVSMLGNSMMKNNRAFKKKANKMLRSVGSIVNNAQYMMK